MADKNNPWVSHAFNIADRIREDFSNIKKAEHLGNRYDNTGDILILTEKEEFFVEIKMSETKKGIGTKANIGQDALADNNLFKENVVKWSDFRKNRKHNRWVDKYLDEFMRYPKKVLRIKNSVSRREEKARHLRKLRKKGNKKATDILLRIREKDKKEKIDYLNYLESFKQDKEKIRRFLVLIMLGIHRKEIIREFIENDSFLKEAQNLFVYYSNTKRGKIIVQREDVGNKIRKILNTFSEFRIIFPKRTTHCKLIGIKGENQQPLLQIVFHWKNIAQGIKTPCLNIFDLSSNIFPKY